MFNVNHHKLLTKKKVLYEKKVVDMSNRKKEKNGI